MKIRDNSDTSTERSAGPGRPADVHGPADDPRPSDPVARLPPAERLRINEIFYSIQGESTFAGAPCVLVRLTGCQMRCTWCDTPYSFHDGTWMTRAQVLDAIAAFGCPLVELTGGEPLLQPGAAPLMRALCDAGYTVLLETGGGVSIADVDPRVHRIVDVKCPASGESENMDWDNLLRVTRRDELKFVLADEADYAWARDLVIARDLTARVRAVHFSPVHAAPGQPDLDREQLAQWILRDRLPVRLQLQLHKFIWHPKTRGV
ncbi:MAG: radical SAM protein [Acidobacteriota bacterium]